MNRHLIVIAAALLSLHATQPARAAEPVDLQKAIVGIWHEKDDEVVMEFLADGTMKVLPMGARQVLSGVYMPLKWSLGAGGKLKMEGLPGNEVPGNEVDQEWVVRVEGDAMTLLKGDRSQANFERLKELPASVKDFKPASLDVMIAAFDKGLMLKMASDGKEIHWAMLHAKNPVYPKNGTSTEYFQKMLLDKNFGFRPGAFGGPGFPAETPPGQLKAGNVAWMLLADAADAPPKLPLLLSRNVEAEKVSDLKGRIADTLADRPPFGGKGVVLILKDYSALIFAGKDLETKWETVLGELPAGEPDRKYLQP
ncbi:MAG: hypothetical protein NTW21_13830 [Verrucomicrobia bacterium]|nr:hypothetical protein [Verrucomicrobiota bacterium]